MNVVFKPSVLDKVRDSINLARETGREIERIELNNDEFRQLLANLKVFDSPDDIHYSFGPMGAGSVNYSGSYVVLQGVCIQTHESYE